MDKMAEWRTVLYLVLKNGKQEHLLSANVERIA
jgi:hypothetical protein